MSLEQRIEELERELAAAHSRLATLEGAAPPSTHEAVLNRVLGDRLVLDNLPDMVAVMDPQHRIVYLNNTIPGRNTSDSLGKSVFAYIPPDFQDAYRETLERAWATGELQSTQVQTISDLWWEVRLIPVKERGQVMFMLATSVDVTKRRRAEEALRESERQLRHAIFASGMGTWTWERSSDLTVWDARLCEIFGVRPEDAPRDFDTYVKLLHPDDRDAVVGALGRILESGVYEDLEHRLIRPDGEVRHVLCKGTCMLDTRGQPIGFRGGVFDVTTRKRLEVQLNQAQKMEAVGQLTAGIAHNFNNALSVIIHNAALSRDQVNEDVGEQLAEIEYAGKRAAEMVRQLMIFARADSHARKVSTDLVRSAQRTLEMCRRTMDPRIVLDLEVGGGEIAPVQANAGQIEQVLLNICLNARDALQDARTPSPRILIRIEPGRADEVRVRVSDNGPGMPEAVRVHVFEPFFTTKEVGRGTGLGLAMAYSIVVDHRGRIDCQSQPGLGTSFEIALPVATNPDLAPSKADGRVPRGQSETILLIDDEAPVRRALREILLRGGYAVLEAPDGPTGLAMYERDHARIDLVVLDRSMPGLPGEVVLERLTQLDPTTPVVLLSGHPGADDGEGARPAAVLSKPTERATLLRTVRDVLDRR